MLSRLSNRTFLALSLSIWFSVGCVQAQDAVNVSKLEKAEKLLLGKIAPDQTVEERLDALENSLYGKTKHGSDGKRMDGISDFLGIKDEVGNKPVTSAPQGEAATEVKPLPESKAAAPAEELDHPKKPVEAPATRQIVVEPKPTPVSTKQVSAPVLGAKLTPLVDQKASLSKASVAAAKVVQKKSVGALKAQEPQMAAPPVAPTRGVEVMPPAAPPIAATMSRKGNEWNTQARDLLREGLRLHSSGQYREAEHTFRHVLTVDPRNADAFYNLGSLAERNHDYVMALTNYRAALNFNPKDNDYIQAVASMERQLASANDAQKTATVGHFNVPEFAASSGTTDGSTSAPFQLSGTQNDVLLNTNMANGANAPSLAVSQNNPPTIGVSQRPPSKTRGAVGVMMNVGLRYALNASGLHCPACRILGGGFHF